LVFQKAWRAEARPTRITQIFGVNDPLDWARESIRTILGIARRGDAGEMPVDVRGLGEDGRRGAGGSWGVLGAVRIALASSLTVLAGIGMVHLFTGDALAGVRVYANSPRAYGGQLVAWPFESLVMTPLRMHVGMGKVLYIGVHVAIVVSACFLLMGQTWRILPRVARGEQSAAGLAAGSAEDSCAVCLPSADLSADARGAGVSGYCFLTIVSAVWLVGNTAFVLCIGSTWGFAHFPRFCIPAQPALFWGVRRWLPGSRGFWLILGVLLVVMGVYGVRSTP
jgi:hypothetical protein